MGIFNIMKESQDKTKNLTDEQCEMLCLQKAVEVEKMHKDIHKDLLILASYWQNKNFKDFQIKLKEMINKFDDFDEKSNEFNDIYNKFN